MSVQSEIDFIRQIVIHSPGSEHNFTLPKNTQEWVGDKNGKLIQNPDYLLFDDIISTKFAPMFPRPAIQILISLIIVY